MMVECLISFIEARKLVRKMPEKHEQEIKSKRAIFKFYSPLMYSSLIVVMIGPAINVSLGKTADIELAIASFAIATSLTQLIMSFFSYIHQIVINFNGEHNILVKKFVLLTRFSTVYDGGYFILYPAWRVFLRACDGGKRETIGCKFASAKSYYVNGSCISICRLL